MCVTVQLFVLASLIFIASSIKPDDGIQIKNTEENNCKCGVFNAKTVKKGDVPLMIHSPLKVTCDAIGTENCKGMCYNLAKMTKRGPEILCDILLDYNKPLQPSIFSRVCEESEWIYTNITSPEVFCCKGGESIKC